MRTQSDDHFVSLFHEVCKLIVVFGEEKEIRAKISFLFAVKLAVKLNRRDIRVNETEKRPGQIKSPNFAILATIFQYKRIIRIRPAYQGKTSGTHAIVAPNLRPLDKILGFGLLLEPRSYNSQQEKERKSAAQPHREKGQFPAGVRTGRRRNIGRGFYALSIERRKKPSPQRFYFVHQIHHCRFPHTPKKAKKDAIQRLFLPAHTSPDRVGDHLNFFFGHVAQIFPRPKISGQFFRIHNHRVKVIVLNYLVGKTNN